MQVTKITKKLLSAVIIAAICFTTVFSGLVTVNADENNATYTITAETVYAYADRGEATVTFNLPSGFTGGNFTLLKNFIELNLSEYDLKDADENGRLDLPSLWNFEYNDVTIEAISGTATDGSTFSSDDFTIDYTIKDTVDEKGNAKDEESPVNPYIEAEDGVYDDAYHNATNGDRCETDRLTDVEFSSTKEYTSVTFKLSFEWEYHIRPNQKADIRIATAEQSDRYGKAYSDPVLTKGEDELKQSFVLTENNPTGNINYFHYHKFNLMDENNKPYDVVYDNDYTIYNGVCEFCGATNHQLKTENTGSWQSNTYYDISGVNVQYESDGTVSLNVHCTTFNGANEKLIVCYADGTKYREISGSEAVNSYYAKSLTVGEDGTKTYGENLLPNGTMMYVISGLSAKDIETEFYLTRCVNGTQNGNAVTFWGNTHEISLLDYCTGITTDNKAFYPAGTTEEQVTADRKVAAAFVNYGIASTNALNNKVDTSIDNVLTWNGSIASGFSDTEHGGTSWDDAIIINTPQELAYLVIGAGGTTEGKYYKIADGITHFNMNGMQGITPDSTAADVETAAENPIKNWKFGAGSGSSFTDELWDNNFNGNFDGNGVVIYNLYTNGSQWSSMAGLFPYVKAARSGSTIKNLTVNASYFKSTGDLSYTGALVACADNNNCSLNVLGCTVSNCVISSENNSGTVIGSTCNATVTLNNCLALSNKVLNTEKFGGLIGANGSYGTATLKNSISIGTESSFTGTNVTCTNLYTNVNDTATGVTVLNDSDFKGSTVESKILTFEWGCDWFAGKTGEYPTLNGTPYIDYWDGTIATAFESGTGSKTDPYIIATAEQLAYAALSQNLVSVNKYFKVADNIKYFNMNGFDGITPDSTASDINSATVKNSNKWVSDSSAFCGNFDGNGVVIYNLNSSGSAHAGLFPNLTVGENSLEISISNVTVRASKFGGYHAASGIIGQIQDGRNAKINLSRCAVENSVIGNDNNTSTATRKESGAVIGNVTHSGAVVDNCLAVGNIFEEGNITGGFIGNSSGYSNNNNSIKVTNSVAIGTKPYSTAVNDVEKGTRITSATYVNVYTDQTVDSGSTGITYVENSKMQGETAQTAMPELIWNKLWFVTDKYPTLVSDNASKLPAAIETLLETYKYNEFLSDFDTNYSRDTFTTNDVKCDLYATSLNLKTNPYIAVTFAFLGDYRANKDDVTAKFSVNGQSFEVKASEMKYSAESGRYHLARFKGIEVKNLCDDISVELWYNGSKIGNGSISVAGFAFTAMDAGEGYEYYADVAKAIVFYAECLQEKSAAYSK